MGGERIAERNEFLQQAIARFQQTLAIDSENVTAHYNLSRIYGLLSEHKDDEYADLAAEHERQHKRYRPDDNALDVAFKLVGKKYPAAIAAARAGNIYPLRRPTAPELPEPHQLREESRQGISP